VPLTSISGASTTSRGIVPDILVHLAPPAGRLSRLFRGLHFVSMKYKDETAATSTGFFAMAASGQKSTATDVEHGATTLLQRRLAADIAGMIRAGALAAGTPLNQLQLAQHFGVSRSPVRAALQLLAEAGVVSLAARGASVRDAAAPFTAEDDGGERLIAIIAADRHRGALDTDVTEADLMRRYDASRAEIAAALRRLAELGLMLRKPGFGWRFLVAAETVEEKRAAYRFRLAIEPAALREPGYRAAPEWLASMRGQHEHYLSRRWRDGDAVAFFEMNAAFHLGLVGFSGNRFFVQATEQQNSLRRLRNYSWRLGEERVRVSCQEHLAILAALEAGDAAEAARRLVAHLSDTARLVGGSLHHDGKEGKADDQTHS
jgi:DNA-binding GntR family transcriptional regulator